MLDRVNLTPGARYCNRLGITSSVGLSGLYAGLIARPLQSGDMSSRSEQKQRAREERLAAEQAERAKALRTRRLAVLGGVVVLVLAAVVIALTVTGGSKDEPVKKAQSTSLFAGIPQSGLTLGNPKAPATVEEYLDLQCPICKQFSEQGLETLVNDYVRTGKVKLVMRPIAILGEDSVPAAQTAIAAGRQGKAWDFTETFYANQGVENSGYVTDAFLDDVAKQVSGLDAAKALSSRNSAQVKASFTAVAARQAKFGINSTPSFLFARRGKPATALSIQVGDPNSVKSALDTALGSAQ